MFVLSIHSHMLLSIGSMIRARSETDNRFVTAAEFSHAQFENGVKKIVLRYVQVVLSVSILFIDFFE